MWIAVGAMSGFLAVAAGAFGAHALRDRLTPEMLAIYNTGAHYHLLHAVALVAVGLLGRTDIVGASEVEAAAGTGRGARYALGTELSVRLAGWGFLLGTILFAGSLYMLAISGVKAWGAVTPFGGVAFLVGWAGLAVAGLRRR